MVTGEDDQAVVELHSLATAATPEANEINAIPHHLSLDFGVQSVCWVFGNLIQSGRAF
jgi:hypothetical protein